MFRKSVTVNAGRFHRKLCIATLANG